MNAALHPLVLTGHITLFALTACAQAAADDATLLQQLAAQKAINEQLHARITTLERQLATTQSSTEAVVLSLDADAPKPPVESTIANTAIEAALVSKGLILLPVGEIRLTPSLTWSHDESGDKRNRSLISALSLEVGLLGGLAAAVSQPYLWRDDLVGHYDGMGDLKLSLSKKLTQQSAYLPSFVLRLDYTPDTGSVFIGQGFQSFTTYLSAIKLIEPLALHGHISYTHAWNTSFIRPGDQYGLGFGVSLAATPNISLDVGLSLNFISSDILKPFTGVFYETDSATVGYLELSADYMLSRFLSLTLSADIGITEDAHDVIFSMALPLRF